VPLEILNPKSESRNKSEIQNPKIKNKPPTFQVEISDSGSHFGFRLFMLGIPSLPTPDDTLPAEKKLLMRRPICKHFAPVKPGKIPRIVKLGGF
jgi:hypothetical protein